MDCHPPLPGGALPSPGSLRASGEGASAAPGPAPPGPAAPRGLRYSCRHLFGPSLSGVPPRQDKDSGVDVCLAPRRSLRGAGSCETERFGAAPPRRPRPAGLARTPIRLPTPGARVPGRAVQAGRGQEGGGVEEPALPGRSGSGAPPPRAGGRSGGAALPGQARPLGGPAPAPARLKCGRLAAKSSPGRLGSPRGGG